MNCKNCGKIVHDNYCGHCGQSINVGKINFTNLIREVSESTLQINTGLLFTLKELFIRPGPSIQEFLNGKRKNHFKPVGFVLIMSTFYFFISRITDQNTWMNEALMGFAEGAFRELEVPPILIWIANNYAYATLLLIPIFSLASFLCFWKDKVNYVEHLVLNSYVTGQQAIFYSFFALTHMVIDSTLFEILPIFVSIAYAFWTFSRFFKKEGRSSNILRSILTYVLYLIFSMVVLPLLLALFYF